MVLVGIGAVNSLKVAVAVALHKAGQSLILTAGKAFRMAMTLALMTHLKAKARLTFKATLLNMDLLLRITLKLGATTTLTSSGVPVILKVAVVAALRRMGLGLKVDGRAIILSLNRTLMAEFNGILLQGS